MRPFSPRPNSRPLRSLSSGCRECACSTKASSPALVANSTAGRFTATAAVAGVARALAYPLRNVAGKPATVTAGAASGEATPAGSRFPIRFAVTVTDADDNPVAGAVGSFTAPGQGPSGRFVGPARDRRGHLVRRRVVRVETDADGVAVAPAFTANAKPGGYVVTATVVGTRKQAAFAVVNRQTG